MKKIFRCGFFCAFIIIISIFCNAQTTGKLSFDYGRTHLASCMVGGSNIEFYRHFILQANGTLLSLVPGGTPQVVPGIDGITAIAAGSQHILALKKDGTVWAWGENGNDQLGNLDLSKSYKNTVTPVQVDDIHDAVAISANVSGSFALLKDGTVWAWGASCGLPDKRERNQYARPARVPGITNAIAISGTMVLLADGSIMTWGEGENGRLGNGTKTRTDVPVKVKGISTAIAIAAREDGAMALLKDGTVWVWGSNYKGYLANGVTYTKQGDCSTVPVKVQGLTDIVAIDMAAVCLVLLKDGTIKAWGWGSTAGLGFRADEVNATPRAVPNIKNAVAIKAGEGTGFAILSDGTLMGWGAQIKATGFHKISYAPVKVATVQLQR